MKPGFVIVSIMCLMFMFSSIEAAETFKIAVIYTWEGSFKQVQYAVKELNPQGTLLGKKIEFIELHIPETALGARLAAKQAVNAGANAVIGISQSSPALGMSSLLQTARIPTIHAYASNPEVTLMKDYIFRVYLIDSFQGKVMANFAVQDLNAKTAVVLTNTSRKQSVGLSQFFIEHFQRQGGQILWHGKYLDETTSFKSLLENIKSLPTEVIYLPGKPRDSGYILKQAREMGISTTFLGTDSWPNIEKGIEKYAGEAVNGSYYSSGELFSYPDAYSEELRALVDLYKNKYGEEPWDMVYDAVAVLFDAVRRANSSDPGEIRKALAATKNFQGVSGKITMDQNGNPEKSVLILKYEKRVPVYVKTVEP